MVAEPSPSFLLASPELVSATAPWCIALDNLAHRFLGFLVAQVEPLDHSHDRVPDAHPILLSDQAVQEVPQ